MSRRSLKEVFEGMESMQKFTLARVARKAFEKHHGEG
jgi:hypothetical protein